MNLHKLLQITTFWVYGGGKGHYNTSSTDKFGGHRAFVAHSVIQQGNLELRVEPTWQNFKYDTYIKQLKDKGIITIWSPQGKLDYQDTIGKAGKVCPIMEAADPLKVESWKDFAELCRQVTIRYADDTQAFLSEARVFTGSPAYLANTPKAGLGLIDFLTGINEVNFKHGWSGATRTMTREMAAVSFKAQFDAVRSVSKTLKLVIPSSIEPTEAWLRGFLVHLKSLYAAEGKAMPTDFYLDFHWYMRNSSSDQSGGTSGETPETVNAYAHGQVMDDLCDEYGLLGWMCTETGWATDNSKQSAPILEGFTREQSQGILMIRLALIWGASKYCKGISFWHCRDDYDLPPYAKGGVNYSNWSGKPARTICEEFLAKYGEMEVEEFRPTGQYFAIKFKGLDKGLIWTDKKKITGTTPMPTDLDLIITPPTEPPTPTMRNAFITATTSASDTFAAQKITEGLNIPIGKYAIYVDGEPPVILELFKDNVSFIGRRIENGKPLAVGGDDSGVLRLKDFPAGSYRLMIDTTPLNFTVGTVTPPPSGDIKGVSFALKASGQIEFTFENGVKKLVNAV